MRQDKKRTAINKPLKSGIKTAVDRMIKTPNAENLALAFKAVDKAVKRSVVHKNKANRLKARVTKVLAQTTKK